MKLRLLILFLSLCYVPANAQMTKEKIIAQQNLNEVKSDRFYITAIANENSLEDLKNKIKKKFDVDISFKKIKYSKLDKIRKIKVIVSHSTFKQEAEFKNTFEISPIEITLSRDENGNIGCKIQEIERI